MSFILDALKKLEQKRQRDNLPNLATVHTPELITTAKKPVWPYLLLAALLLNAGILSAWILTKNTETPDTAPVLADAAGEKPEPAEPLNIENEVKPSEPLLTAPASDSNIVAINAGHEAPSQPAAAGEPSFKPEGLPVESLKPEPVNNEKDETPLILSTDDRVASLELSPSVEELESLKSIIREEQELAGSDKARTGSFETDKNEDQTAQEILELSELPSDIRKEIPDISIFGHIYSGSPSSRLANINGSLVHEGDTVTGKLKVKEITMTGVVFDYKGLRFRVRAF